VEDEGAEAFASELCEPREPHRSYREPKKSIKIGPGPQASPLPSVELMVQKYVNAKSGISDAKKIPSRAKEIYPEKLPRSHRII
jgi:hypothetical protein